MGKKKNNNLIKVVKNGIEEQYFTSRRQAGLFCDKPECSILWHLNHTGKFKDEQTGDMFEISIVDGAEIAYKYINN